MAQEKVGFSVRRDGRELVSGEAHVDSGASDDQVILDVIEALQAVAARSALGARKGVIEVVTGLDLDKGDCG